MSEETYFSYAGTEFDASVTVIDAEIPKSQQSANTLFHFVNKFEYLIDTLSKPYLYPRYCMETYTFLPNSPTLVFPMKCFCDIYIEKLYLHCKDYGSYGIGFARDGLITQGVQPVQYINIHSDLGESLLQYHESFIQNSSAEWGTETFYNNNLFRYLKYCKPLSGEIQDIRGAKHEKFLPDEREWRFIPRNLLDLGINPFLKPLNPGLIKPESEKLKGKNKIALHYRYEDIKYIIVPNETDSERLRNFIAEQLDVSEEIKRRLMSKIQILSDMRDDM